MFYSCNIDNVLPDEPSLESWIAAVSSGKVIRIFSECMGFVSGEAR